MTNTATVPISVTSHFHFFEVNARLRFDRAAAYGRRPGLPAGATLRLDPGQTVQIELVPIGGDRVVIGFAGLVDGPLDAPGASSEALRHGADACGYLDRRPGRPPDEPRARADYIACTGRAPATGCGSATTGLVVEVESRLAAARRRVPRRLRQDRPRRHAPEGRRRPRHLRPGDHQRGGHRPAARHPQGVDRHPARAASTPSAGPATRTRSTGSTSWSAPGPRSSPARG